MITCRSDLLLEALKIAGEGVATKSPVKILESFRVQPGAGGGLEIGGSDGILFVQSRLPGGDHSFDPLCIPARQMMKIIGSLKVDTVSLSSVESSLEVRTRSEGGPVFTIKGTSADDFPVEPDPADILFELPQSLLQNMIRKTVYAVPSDGESTRGANTGLFFCISGSDLTLSGNDGRRLTWMKEHVKMMGAIEGEELSFLISGKYIMKLQRLLSTGNVGIGINMAHVFPYAMFDLGTTRLYTPVMNSGKFPRLEKKLVTFEEQGRAVVETEVLTQTLKMALIVANDSVGESGHVSFSISDSGIVCQDGSADPDAVVRFREEIDAVTQGERSVININGNYLLEFLATVDSSRVCMKAPVKDVYAVFEVVGQENCKSVIALVRVRDSEA